MDHSLIVKHNNEEVFTSRGKWLFPLFDLDDFLSEQTYPPEELHLKEKVAGQAAAFLIVRLGIRSCHVKLISDLALSVFNRFNTKITFDEQVPQIQCRTENILMKDMEPETAWQLLRRRAGRVHGADVVVEKLEVNIHGKSLINGLDLEVHRGDGLIISGENGVGKTTLLRTILGLQKFTTGIIKIADLQVGSLVWKKNRHISAYVNQERSKSLFPVSAAEVVEIGLAGRKLSKEVIWERVQAAMQRTGCLQLADHPFHKLSGGQKQRVSLARCLCQKARVFLLDEPTTFLDPKARDDLYELLVELWEKEAPTILMVSHDSQWIDRFHWEVKEMKEGRIC